ENGVANQPVKLLTPFDNIIRERHYPLNIWDFEYKLESYVPPTDRKFGYHVLPILDGFNIIGRVDAKVYRSENRMELISLYLEDEVWKQGPGLERLVQGFREFCEFHQVEEISMNKVSPKSAKKKIIEQL
ncbi:MAG: DNA glycosylase AlkZ-like family protein, partial [Candidatus Thorarchaeota archaeon]